MSDKDQVNEEGLHEDEVQQELDPNQEEITENQEHDLDSVAKLEDELKDLKDQNLRLYAEFENFRRRTAKERLELMESANKDTLTVLLPVLDDFDRALKNIEETEANAPVLEGMKLISHKLQETLKGKGLKEMESTVGQAFDVETMEAITQIPAPTAEMVGKVIDEVEKGYLIGEKVIRYAKVVVGKEA
ncbi:MAG: nucleotide exchange factor GrpE [Schleiferiaceae bacterium]|nr:nucleotide exchange factor GrpE [Schleiferiaceae bacterium]